MRKYIFIFTLFTFMLLLLIRLQPISAEQAARYTQARTPRGPGTVSLGIRHVGAAR